MSGTVRETPATPGNYDPLPVGHQHHDPTFPPSPMASQFFAGDLPAGAARPHFQGAALRDASSRASLSSENHGSRNSDYDSVYALNPVQHGPTSQTQLSRYHDNPSEVFNNPRYSTYPAPSSPPPVGGALNEKRSAYASPRTKSRRKWFIILGGLGLILLIVAIAVPVYLFAIKPKRGDSGSLGGGGDGDSSNDSIGGGTDANGVRLITGGDGTEITTEDGSTFTYRNSFGGYWYFDETDPFNNAARAQEFSPALNETFRYGIDPIRGVNLGGWLNIEPFISPALFERYQDLNPPPDDEFSLSEAMRADTANGGISQLEEHYRTFITEKDFAEIAGAGLNWVRIPIPYWAIEAREGEPFLEKTCWTYFLKAIAWARKYGIRINLDLHALPGSQNGWNHSGKLGEINVLNGPMGRANADRSLDYIRIFAQFISQPQYKDVVPMFGIVNEPRANLFGRDPLERFYLEAYRLIRDAGGIGEGNGPMISLHDGFLGTSTWNGYLPGADRISLDNHPYLCFNEQSAAPVITFADTACTTWASTTNDTLRNFGLFIAGEFSNAVNDCGLFVNGVGLGTRFEGTFAGDFPVTGSCDPYLDWESWTDDLKAEYKEFALASMDALQNYFFWTWKIGPSLATGRVMAPQWSYQLGLENGWMPTDPREATGRCGGGNPFLGPLLPSQTGGEGAGTIAAVTSEALSWPPPQISNGGDVELLPSYTPTGVVPTLPVPTFTFTSDGSVVTADAGVGWANLADTAGLMTDIAGCQYLDPWIGPDAAPPPVCTPAAKRSAIPEPQLTAAPL